MNPFQLVEPNRIPFNLYKDKNESNNGASYVIKG